MRRVKVAHNPSRRHTDVDSRPDFPIAPEVKQALRDAVEAEDVFYNTDTAAKAAMAEKINSSNKIAVTPDDIQVIQGVDPSLWLAAKYACKTGDEVILTDPMYTPFKNGLDERALKPSTGSSTRRRLPIRRGNAEEARHEEDAPHRRLQPPQPHRTRHD